MNIVSPPTNVTKLTPQRAVDWFASKIAIPSNDYRSILDSENEIAFWIAGVTSAQFLEAMRLEVATALREGVPFSDFAKQARQTATRAGWNPNNLPWRLSLIYSNNTRSAYAAGRWKQMNALRDRRPYWQYLHRDSRHPRPHHKALHLNVYPADSPFWQLAYPPNGHFCRCAVVTLSDRDLEREGLSVDSPPQADTIAEPGWRYAPGSNQTSRKQALQQIAARLPDPLQQWIRKLIMGGLGRL